MRRALCVEVERPKRLHVGTFKKKNKTFKRNNNHCKRDYALFLLKAPWYTQNVRNHFDLLPMAELYYCHKYGRMHVGRLNIICEPICA